MNKIFKKIKDESGQAMVIVALSAVVLFGATALSVDLGMAYNVKAELQAAADAAALAGAQELPSPYENPPNYDPAKRTAVEYASLNGVEIDIDKVVAPYAGDGKLIQVTCTKQHEYFFGGFFGFDAKTITATAVAEIQYIWGKETLPFINIDDDYKTDNKIVLWEQTGQGDFEVLSNLNPPSYEFMSEGKGNDATTFGCMLVGLDDGTLDLRNGVNEGIVKDVDSILNLWSNGDFVYVLSLRDIPQDPVNYIKGADKNLKDGKDSVTIGLDELVLLKCKIDLVATDTKGASKTRGIVLTLVPGSIPIELVEALREETPIPGFINHSFVIKLVK